MPRLRNSAKSNMLRVALPFHLASASLAGILPKPRSALPAGHVPLRAAEHRRGGRAAAVLRAGVGRARLEMCSTAAGSEVSANPPQAPQGGPGLSLMMESFAKMKVMLETVARQRPPIPLFF